MTDPELIAKRLAFIETRLRELSTLARLDRIHDDLKEERLWISRELAAKLGDMAGFRNVLVHGYQDVNLDVVVDAVRNRLEDLVTFVTAIRRRLPAS